jgi:hypothetical protein
MPKLCRENYTSLSRSKPSSCSLIHNIDCSQISKFSMRTSKHIPQYTDYRQRQDIFPFPKHPDNLCGPPSLSTWTEYLFSGSKTAAAWIWPLTKTQGWGLNAWRYNSLSYMPSWPVQGQLQAAWTSERNYRESCREHAYVATILRLEGNSYRAGSQRVFFGQRAGSIAGTNMTDIMSGNVECTF